MTPGQQLRDRLLRPGPILVAGAHNGLSARLAERAGFDAIWASGFEISASHAVPDANILTMAENLGATRSIRRAVSIPVLCDCDNGYGNAINVIRTVEEFEAAGAAGLCIEDNIFPKRCSFYAGVKRELESVGEFTGKVRAAVGARHDASFFVIARTEALIAGWGLDEAIVRARAYADAGADAVLVHSKSSDWDEVRRVAERLERQVPLVAVPTIYRQTHARDLNAAGFRIVIFANHGLRASVQAMQEVFAELVREQRPGAVDSRIVSLEAIYELVGVSEMKKQEKDFLPAGGDRVRAIVTAAGRDAELGPLVDARPKCMLDIKGRTILERQVEALNACNIRHVAVVRGWRKECIDLPNLVFYDNDRYAETHVLASVLAARKELEAGTPVLTLYGDILFDKSIVERLLMTEADIAIAVDRAWVDLHDRLPARPLGTEKVVLDTRGERSLRFIPGERDGRVLRIGKTVPDAEADGEFIGVAYFSPKGARTLLEACDAARAKGGPIGEAPSFDLAGLADVLQSLIHAGVRIAPVVFDKGWLEIDTFEDYQRAWAAIPR